MKRENQLLENKKMREEVVGRIEVLEQVGELLLLPNTDFATKEMVSQYYGIKLKTLESCIEDNQNEIQNNGMRLYKRAEIEEMLKNTIHKKEFKIPNRGMILFPKKAILTVGLLLKDSSVANEIKKELGLPIQFKSSLRKEIKFKEDLDKGIVNIRKSIRYSLFYEEDYVGKEINDLHKIINKAIDSITAYETQYPCCNGKYRVDFYFPKLNIAIEYDEKYHKRQKEKDEKREYEIMKDVYIDKYYKQYSDEEIKEWGYKSREVMFDEEYRECQLDCSFDMTRFVRIQEENEIEGLMSAVSMIAITATNIINSRGMSCKYDDLIA